VSDPDPFAGAEPTLAPYASSGRRFVAVVVDGLVLALPFVLSLAVALAVTDGREDEDSDVWALVGLAWLLWMVMPFLYFTVVHGRKPGQTVGKRLLGIRVVGEDFRPIGYGRAFGRYLMGSVMWLACYVPGIVDSLWPLWDQRNQALHDKVANSIVVGA
jgi:uncharacterized RDD family membrane protein YckC